MKFCKYLGFYMIPEWAKHYIDYWHLKEILKQLSRILKGMRGLSPRRAWIWQQCCFRYVHVPHEWRLCRQYRDD